jgi:glycosyl transferase family 25
MKAFVLNLERHTDRRAAIEKQLQGRGIDYEILPAVDGQKLSADTLAAIYAPAKTQEFLGRQLTMGEIGCAMSHCMALGRVVSDNLPAALILEDDAFIGPMVKRVIDSLEEAVSRDNYDVCLLTYVAKYSVWGARDMPGTESVLVPAIDSFHGYGYVVTNRGARQLIEYFSTIYHPFDYWNTFRRKRVIRVKAIVPYVIGQSDLGAVSELDEERRRISAGVSFGYLEGMKRLARRVLYEKFIYQLVKPMLRIRRQSKGALEKQFAESQVRNTTPE